MSIDPRGDVVTVSDDRHGEPFIVASHDLARRLLAAQDAAIGEEDDNAAFTRDVGQPVTRAVFVFGEGDYGETVRLLKPIRGIAHRFGGSHAQRDVIDLTLIEAAFRAGNQALSAALAAERRDARPDSPLSQLFARRAGLVAA